MRDLVGLCMCNDRFQFLMVHSSGMDLNSVLTEIPIRVLNSSATTY
jgi:hypothetical protein